MAVLLSSPIPGYPPLPPGEESRWEEWRPSGSPVGDEGLCRAKADEKTNTAPQVVPVLCFKRENFEDM